MATPKNQKQDNVPKTQDAPEMPFDDVIKALMKVPPKHKIKSKVKKPKG